MLDSIVARQQGIVDSGAASSTLESGILAQAFAYAIARYPAARDKYSGYLSSVLDVASASFTDASYAAKRPLDRFSLATAIDAALVSHAGPVTARSSAAYAASTPRSRCSPGTWTAGCGTTSTPNGATWTACSLWCRLVCWESRLLYWPRWRWRGWRECIFFLGGL
ncbi:hypothetical protein J3459_014644 [Metarhizium acridum]|uniref:uncharacterized protein n=1 Tax=Metarhizium acridum TaxID=92637 RepID=UPI001C6B2854|nr:hypothetical protein J3458_014488 [Metarhizium acridum]KAG8414542.1 hypothetical protein J3459_014644 [Metarhizium acridum]